jgi:hypothetical protein
MSPFLRINKRCPKHKWGVLKLGKELEELFKKVSVQIKSWKKRMARALHHSQCRRHMFTLHVRQRHLDVLVTYDTLVALRSVGIRLVLVSDKYPLSYWLFRHRLPLTKSKYLWLLLNIQACSIDPLNSWGLRSDII